MTADRDKAVDCAREALSAASPFMGEASATDAMIEAARDASRKHGWGHSTSVLRAIINAALSAPVPATEAREGE